MGHVLEVNDLWVKYYTASGAVSAVSGVSFGVGKGEMLAVVGESGSGKSTLGFALLNMVPPPGKIVRGEVLLEGVNVLALSGEEARRLRGSRISMVFQDPFTTLDPLRRVSDQFIEFLMEHGLGRDDARRVADESLASVGIPEKLRSAYPHQLSGGQKQRVAIAMAIALRPAVVVADEPTTALDVIVQKQIMALMSEVKRGGVSIVLITHDIALALEWADRVMVMYGGELMEVGRKGDLLRSQAHPYTRGLFASIPKLLGELPKSIPGYPPDLRSPPPGCVFHPRCELATERCRREKPALVDLGAGHLVRCHLAGGPG